MRKNLNKVWFEFLQVPSNIIKKVVLPAAIFLLLIQFIAFTQKIPFYHFVADINELPGLPPYVGMVSTIGILFWCATAVICLFTAYTLKKCGYRDRKGINYLLFFGYFNLLILSDDLFQIHEHYFLLFINLNLFDNPRIIQDFFEAIFFLIYVILLATCLLRFNSFLRKTQYPILILSILFFAFSTVADLLTPATMRFHFLLEEGAKFIGIVTWFSYFANCAYQEIRQMNANILSVANNFLTNP